MSTPTQAGFWARSAASACYLVALAGAAALAGRVLLLGLDVAPRQSTLANPWPWLVDLAWLAGFSLQHSGMARGGCKRLWTKIVPVYLERSVYAALSGLLLLGLAATWQPLPGEPLWQRQRWLLAIALIASAGLVFINLRFDHAGLFGLRQVWEQGRESTPERLLVIGPYRYVRHPLMACLLVVLWAQPTMSSTLLLLSGGLTVTIAIGLVLEERDLVSRFGPAYVAYRRYVPALLPWKRPARPATYLSDVS